MAGIYYIDYGAADDSANGTTTLTPWKRAPGMTGFTGTYSHAVGDTFYFKLGVTWASACFPWTVANSGSAGNVDTYTTIAGWGTVGQPIFDANHTEPAGGMLIASSKSYLTFNNLHFTSYATTGVAEAKKAIDFLNCQQITFNANTFDCYCWITLYAHFDSAGTYSNWTITNNTVSHTTSLCWFASAATGITRAGLTMTGNTAFDFSSQIGGGIHGDGFLHTFTVPAADATQPLTGLVFANNYAYGDFRNSFAGGGAMTAFFFTEDNVTGYVYNNVFVPSPVQASMFDGFMVLGTASNGGSSASLQLYNNTLVNPGTSSASAGIHIVDKGTFILKNNLVTGLGYAVYNEVTTGTYTYDYNLFVSGTGNLVYGASFQSYATWQGAGRDTNGVLGTAPTFVNSPTDVSLTNTSAGRSVGADLTALGVSGLNTAYNGISRPNGSPWDMGAYMYYAGGTAARGLGFIMTPH